MDDAFVNLLYQSVLLRTTDADGLAYWKADLTNGVVCENVLVSFSVSTGNVANVNLGQNGFHDLWETHTKPRS